MNFLLLRSEMHTKTRVLIAYLFDLECKKEGNKYKETFFTKNLMKPSFLEAKPLPLRLTKNNK